MSGFDFLLALLMNVRCVIVGLAMLFGFITGFFFFMMLSEAEFASERELEKRRKQLVKSFICFLIVAILACIPSIEDIWRVRIGLIKLELASPENLQKASDTIERIGHKLECKYLGCDEKKDGE